MALSAGLRNLALGITTDQDKDLENQLPNRISSAQLKVQELGGEIPEKKPNVLGWLLENLPRTSYAASNMLREFTNPDQGYTAGKLDPLAAWVRGFKKTETPTGKDIFTDMGMSGDKAIFGGGDPHIYNPSPAGLLGLGLDIVNPADPINWLTLGLGGVAKSGGLKGADALNKTFGSQGAKIASLLGTEADDLGARTVGKLIKQTTQRGKGIGLDEDGMKNLVSYLREGMIETGVNPKSKINYWQGKPITVGLQNPFTLGMSKDIAKLNIPGSEHLTAKVSQAKNAFNKTRIGDTLGEMFDPKHVSKDAPNRLFIRENAINQIERLVKQSIREGGKFPLSAEELKGLKEELKQLNVVNVYDISKNVGGINFDLMAGVTGIDTSTLLTMFDQELPFTYSIAELVPKLQKNGADLKTALTQATRLRAVMDKVIDLVPNEYRSMFKGTVMTPGAGVEYFPGSPAYGKDLRGSASPFINFVFNHKGMDIALPVNSSENFNPHMWDRLQATIKVLDGMDEGHLAKIKEAVELAPVDLGDASKKVAGGAQNPVGYRTEYGNIVLSDPKHYDEALKHEFGHEWLAMDRMAGGGFINDYIKAGQSDITNAGKKPYVSDYSEEVAGKLGLESGLDEDVAESFSQYFRNKEQFAAEFPARAALIEKALADGRLTPEELSQIAAAGKARTTKLNEAYGAEYQLDNIISRIDESLEETFTKTESTVDAQAAMRQLQSEVSLAFESGIAKGEDFINQVKHIFKDVKKEDMPKIIALASKIDNLSQVVDMKGNRVSFFEALSDRVKPTFYSHLRKVVDEKVSKNIPVGDLKNLLKANGVKDEELAWTFLDEFLEGKSKVTKADLQEWLNWNQLEIEETFLLDSNRNKVPLRETPYPEWMENSGQEVVVRLMDEWNNNPTIWGQPHNFDGADDLYPVQAILEDFEDGLTGRLRDLDLVMEDIEDEYGLVKFVHQVLADSGATGPMIQDDAEYILDVMANFIKGGDPAGRVPEFSNYTLPGLKSNYGELLINLPQGYQYRKNPVDDALLDDMAESLDPDGFTTKVVPSIYTAPHFSKNANLVAHARFDERIIEGKRVLFIEEFQSDWHQAGVKRGYHDSSYRRLPKDEARFQELTAKGVYKTEDEYKEWMRLLHITTKGVQDAPFKKSWRPLIMKRLLKYANENGYEGIAWTTGTMQNKRWSQTKLVDAISYNPTSQKLITYDAYGAEYKIKEIIDLQEGGKLSDYLAPEHIEALKLDQPANLQVVGSADNSGAWFEVVDDEGRRWGIYETQEKAQKVVDGYNITEQGMKRLDFEHDGEIMIGKGFRETYDEMAPREMNEILKKIKANTQVGKLKMGRGPDGKKLPDYVHPETVDLRIDPDLGGFQAGEKLFNGGPLEGYIDYMYDVRSFEEAEPFMDALLHNINEFYPVNGDNLPHIKEFFKEKFEEALDLDIIEGDMKYVEHALEHYNLKKLEVPLRTPRVDDYDLFGEVCDEFLDDLIYNISDVVDETSTTAYVDDFLGRLAVNYPNLNPDTYNLIKDKFDEVLDIAIDDGEMTRAQAERAYRKLVEELDTRDLNAIAESAEQNAINPSLHIANKSKPQEVPGLIFTPELKTFLDEQPFPLFKDRPSPDPQFEALYESFQELPEEAQNALTEFVKWRESVVNEYRNRSIPINVLEKYVPFVFVRKPSADEMDALGGIFGTGSIPETDDLSSIVSWLSGTDPNLKPRTTQASNPADVNRILKKDLLSEDAAVIMATRGTRAIRAIELYDFADTFSQKYGMTIDEMAKYGSPKGYKLYQPTTTPDGRKMFKEITSNAEILENTGGTMFLPEEMVKIYNQYADMLFGDPGMNKLLKTYDKATSLYKKLAYLWNPGHIVRDFTGNVWNGYLMGLTDPKIYKEAFDYLSNPDKLVKIPGYENLTAKQFIAKARQHGALDIGSALAEFQNDALVGVKKAHNPAMKALKGYSWAMREGTRQSDTFTRLAGLIYNLRDGKNWDEALVQVKKFYFDYFELTSFERKVMKRIIPFYTWMRKNIPLQLEQAIKNPRELQRVSEVMNAAAGEPIDWGEQPDYIQEMGAFPVGNSQHYLSPNLPYSDLSRGLPTGEAARDWLSATNPILRAPIELATNTQWFSGAPIAQYPGQERDLPLAGLLRSLGIETPSIKKQGLGYFADQIPLLRNLDSITNPDNPRRMEKASSFIGGPGLYKKDAVQRASQYDELEQLEALIRLLKEQQEK